jgi:hypothetical protein
LCYNRRAVRHTGQQEIPTAERGKTVDETTNGRTAGEAVGEPVETNAANGEHAQQYCPVCSQRLESRRCKLICTVCGYYMSCADYY